MRRNETAYPIWMKFGALVAIPDVVTYANFGDDQLRGLWMEGPNYPLQHRLSSSPIQHPSHSYRLRQQYLRLNTVQQFDSRSATLNNLACVISRQFDVITFVGLSRVTCVLHARREDLSCRFSVISWILLPVFTAFLSPPRSTAITSRLRSSQILPEVYTRT